MNLRDIFTTTADLRWPVVDEVAPPLDGTIQIWCGILRTDSRILAEYEGLLSDEEASRATRFGTAELRRRFVISRGLLRSILGRCLHTPPQQVRIRVDARGKPHLVVDDGIRFNLSHTGDLLLLAVARGLSVGVDVERIRTLKDSQAIAQRFFSSNEAEWLRQLEGSELDRAFFSLWTRKEAILKATGEGISSGLASIELLEGNGHFKKTVACKNNDTKAGTWKLTELNPAKGFTAALASPGNLDAVQLKVATFQPG